MNILADPADYAKAFGYSSMGAGGLWRLMYPGGDPALVPWVGLAGGMIIGFEITPLWNASNILAGVGAGVFLGELFGQNPIVSAAVGAAAGYFMLTNPEPATSASAKS